MKFEKKSTKYTEQSLEEKLHKIHNHKYNYDNFLFRGWQTKGIIICPQHGEFLCNASNHNNGKGCPYCSGNGRVTTEVFVNRSNKIHNSLYDYSKTQYHKSEEKVCIVCKKHGEYWMLPGNHISGQGCPSCKSPTGEKILWDILVKNNITFLTRYNKFEDCRNPKTGYKLIFDAYIPEYNICVEIDGPQHFRISFKNFHLTEKQFDDIEFRDEVKNKYCRDNKITLIRISYKEFSKMEDILKTYLPIKEY